MTVPAYPLSWPAGWKRMPRHQQATAKFGQYAKGVSIAVATTRVRDELRRMGYRDDNTVISSNLMLRKDGLPYSDQRAPEDAGVAVYWRDGNGMRCMAIDRYTKVADNLAAIAATLDAMRAIERHGGAEILNRAFAGFAALSGPIDSEWWDVLGLDPSAAGAGVTAQYRVLRSQHHPDKGGDPERFGAIQRAYDRACELGRC
jgi:hypothetical protein